MCVCSLNVLFRTGGSRVEAFKLDHSLPISLFQSSTHPLLLLSLYSLCETPEVCMEC